MKTAYFLPIHDDDLIHE